MHFMSQYVQAAVLTTNVCIIILISLLTIKLWNNHRVIKHWLLFDNLAKKDDSMHESLGTVLIFWPGAKAEKCSVMCITLPNQIPIADVILVGGYHNSAVFRSNNPLCIICPSLLIRPDWTLVVTTDPFVTQVFRK